ncbi:carbohydrate ABC transporter permease [Naasia sp. SYSU D00948]|uniref:carbohydrate ABC transporter permease n=1 Tax=Naasia sp. SYSU D00948 TaxID=2817379 RepID=UPI001B30FE7A|nr:carbohydrate ABC transporter permease [Naasia sp. SYSU D00948]
MASSLESRNLAAARPRRASSALKIVLGGLGIAVLVLVYVVPLLWLFASSLKSPDEFSLKPMWSLPEGLHWQNYADAWTRGNMAAYIANSAVATFPAILLLLLTGVMAGFALEVLRWRGRNVVLLTFLTGLMVPLQMILLPLFTMYIRAGLLNSPIALILTYTATGLPLTVFLMAGYYRSLPREIIEAAVVDGASIYRVFFSISLPMLRNAILTIAIVQFFFFWNDLLFALTFTTTNDSRTIQAGLLSFVGQFGQTEWGPTFASICISIVPTLLIYLVLNQRVMKGLTEGAVKG